MSRANTWFESTQHTLHLTRAFGASLYRGFLQSSAGLFRVVIVQTRHGQVSSAVMRHGRHRHNERASSSFRFFHPLLQVLGCVSTLGKKVADRLTKEFFLTDFCGG
ncbi:MAG: hypothetical protein BWY63_02561 [Chloroflexi bacterium ADurb.Bin360]|nr:MAG: hypothetical protein BWY63_02561 [Chloroflexi bacterium ADurb.Bin360]